MHACRWNRFNAAGGGFPDFVAFKETIREGFPLLYRVMFVEAKLNGFLTRLEKDKMKYMQERGFSCFVAYADDSEESGVRMREYVSSAGPEKIVRGSK